MEIKKENLDSLAQFLKYCQITGFLDEQTIETCFLLLKFYSENKQKI